ncbi:MAG: hypothetical protein QXX95_06305 [Nitrososphaerales archaeon]
MAKLGYLLNKRILLHPITKRVKEFLDAKLKLGSITLTTSILSVSFSRTVKVMEPKGYIAYDTNEKSIDGAYIEDSK